MANLTLSIENDVLKRARIRALEEDTSVNAKVADFLRSYSRVGSSAKGTLTAILEHAEQVKSGGGYRDREWRRDELHER